MDVTKVMKMNKLTRELREHGMAESSEDAFAKAETMINKDNKDRLSTQEVVITEPVPHEAEQPQPASQPPQQVQRPFVDPGQKSVLELNMTVKNLHSTVETQAKQIDFMQNKINDMLAEIASMKQKMHSVPKPKPVKQEPKPEVQETIKTEKKEETPSPRSGNYKSEDVSIEKMFYMGPK